MKDFISYTFGGLKASYLARQYIFGILIAVVYFNMKAHNGHTLSLTTMAVLVINTFLYPYARFVYESIARFILGETVFYANAILVLFAKVITMIVCWSAAIFIAPIGLVYIYYRQTRTL